MGFGTGENPGIAPYTHSKTQKRDLYETNQEELGHYRPKCSGTG